MKNDIIKLALIQADLLWQNTHGNLAKFDTLLSEITTDTDIIILPEMFATAFTMNVNELEKPVGKIALEWMKKKAASLNKVIVGSLLFEEKNKYYNRMFWMLPDGSFNFYNKRHLFRMGNEEQVMTAGNKRVIIPYKGMNFMLQVCYDLRFPVFVKNNYDLKNKSFDYDAIIYIANWPEVRKQAYMRLLKARAIENQSYVIWVNRVGTDKKGLDHSGDSQVLDSYGNVKCQMTEFQEGILYATLKPNRLKNSRQDFQVGLDWDQFSIKR